MTQTKAPAGNPSGHDMALGRDMAAGREVIATPMLPDAVE